MSTNKEPSKVVIVLLDETSESMLVYGVVVDGVNLLRKQGKLHDFLLGAKWARGWVAKVTGRAFPNSR